MVKIQSNISYESYTNFLFQPNKQVTRNGWPRMSRILKTIWFYLQSKPWALLISPSSGMTDWGQLTEESPDLTALGKTQPADRVCMESSSWVRFLEGFSFHTKLRSYLKDHKLARAKSLQRTSWAISQSVQSHSHTRQCSPALCNLLL